MASGEISTVLPEGGGAGTAIPWVGGGSVRGSTRRGSGVASGGLMSRSLREFSGSLRANWELLGGQDNPLARSSVSRREDAQDDEEALKWAALESLPTYDRLRTSVFFNSATGNKDPVDVRLLTAADRRQLLDSLLKSNEDENQQILVKMRNRLHKVGIAVPTIEVRYENVCIDADCYVGNRALPTLWNNTQNFFESMLSALHILRTKKRVLTILDDVSGIIKPGRLTLLLGPPSSGKTTLLLALAGKLDKDLRVKGKITYNGHMHDEFVPEKTAAYISQNDLHVGEMTVRETLDFSAQCQGVGTRYELMEEVSRREKQAGIQPEADVDAFMKATSLGGLGVSSSIATDYILRVLGLDVCADTMVGDDLRRGISGGQRKRVTTGEMIVGPTRALFMDEISTGLDSSTTFSIINSLRQAAKILEFTILVSLLQPAPETFNLFDDIILLSEGQVVYHGPRDCVLEFFESCGFKCPDRKGIADFLQEVTSRKDQEQYWSDRQRPYHFVSVRDFREAYQQFSIGTQMKEELAVTFPKEKSHKAALTTEKYSASKMDLLRANYDKQWLLMKRNAVVYIVMILQLAIGAFISMTVFFRTRLQHSTISDGTTYLGALFYAITSLMFNGFGDLAIMITRLPVLIKQRDLLFYPAWSYSVSTIVLSIPITLLQSTVWVCMTYYVTGYAPEADRFFKQLLLLFLVGQMAAAMFRLVAVLCRTMVLANTIGFLVILLTFMLGGFVVPRTYIKKWWIWGYWISPLTYAEQAISVNEMLAPRWQTIPPGNSTKPLGVQVLESRGQFAEAYWYWIGVGALVGYIIIFNIGFTLAIAFMPGVGKPQAVLSEEELAEKQANREGTQVLLKDRKRSKRSHPRRSLRTSSITQIGELQMQQIPSVNSLKRNGSGNNSSDIKTTSPAITKGMVLPFQPLAISFDDISYFVDMPAEMKQDGFTETRLKLLSNITGSFQPGVLTALVGVSGAGKTTLMDVLAGRKTGGYIEGDIRISGFPKNQKTFSRISGYCEQTDIHSPQVTVRESLIFSAWLRLGREVNAETKMSFIEQVMELVEMKSLENALVGLPAITGLSTEQRKRLTIAVELVANPSIIFMDEPTSGLDARAAAIVMRTVRNTVDTGRTVVCTIHQPSIDIFEAFDELLLLKRGGRVIYMGPLGHQSNKLVEYFEAIPGVSKIKEGDNPATWMLEASNVSVESKLGVDFAEIFEKSSLYRRNKELVKELSKPAPESQDLSFPTEFSQPLFQQLMCTLWKQHLTYWRSPDYNLVRLVFTISTGLVFGSLFWNVGPNRTNSTDLFIILGALYGATIFICFNNCGTVQPVVSIERTVFYREKAAGMYSAIPYALAQILIEIPYVLGQSILYAGITYSMIGFEWTAVKFFWFLFVLFFSLISFTFYGMMMVALTPNSQLAQILASFFYALFNLFSGFLITKPRIPAWWIWYYWICPVAWTIYGLVVSQFGDVTTHVQVVGSPDFPTVRDYIDTNFGFKHSFLPIVAGVLVGWAVFFAAIFVLAIKFLNFQRR